MKAFFEEVKKFVLRHKVCSLVIALVFMKCLLDVVTWRM